MKYFITESHFKEYVRLLSEQDEHDYLDDYDDEDFIEVFFEYFRPWVKTNHGEDASRYPMSYLLKKYLVEFCKYVGSDEIDDDDDYWSYTQLEKIGREIVIRLQHKLPSLLPSHKFTEKYTKQIDFIIKNLKLPSWLNISLTEERPYNIIVNFKIDFDLYLKSENDDSVYDYFEEFKSYVNQFMGFEEGNPSHGHIKFDSDIELLNNPFSNPKFVKEFKSKIKSLPGGETIHMIKISYDQSRLKIHLSSKTRQYINWPARDRFRNIVYQMLEKEGYNKEKLNITI